MSDVHVMYRMHGHDGELLYVGITNNPVTRFREHGSAKDWWARVAHIGITTFESRKDLEAAERAAINSEKPRYNVANAGQAPRRKVPPPVARLARVREALGWTLQDLCVRDAGLTPEVVAAWEAGTSDLHPELVAAYMAALGMGSVAPLYAAVSV